MLNLGWSSPMSYRLGCAVLGGCGVHVRTPLRKGRPPLCAELGVNCVVRRTEKQPCTPQNENPSSWCMSVSHPPSVPTLHAPHTSICIGANSNRRRALTCESRGCAAGGVGDGRHPVRPRTAELGGWAQAVRWLLGVRVVRRRKKGAGCGDGECFWGEGEELSGLASGGRNVMVLEESLACASVRKNVWLDVQRA